MTRSTFIDNVSILVIENRLLFPLESILTSSTIANLDETNISDIVSEPSFIQAGRKVLQMESAKFQAAVDACARYNIGGLPEARSRGMLSFAVIKLPS